MAYLNKSRYYLKNTRLQQKKNTGFNYHGKIMQKCVSSYLLENDIIFETFANDVNKIFEFNLDTIKDLKKFYAFAISKHDYDLI